jgi:hypothetical protein
MPAELADGLALALRKALSADHRGTRPNDLGSPLPGLACPGIRLMCSSTIRQPRLRRTVVSGAGLPGGTTPLTTDSARPCLPPTRLLLQRRLPACERFGDQGITRPGDAGRVLCHALARQRPRGLTLALAPLSVGLGRSQSTESISRHRGPRERARAQSVSGATSATGPCSLFAQGSTHMDRSARPTKRLTRAPYAERACRHRALR